MDWLRRYAMQLTFAILAGWGVWLAFNVFGWLASEGYPFWFRPWCTVIASLVLATGSIGALFNKTWGLLVTLVAATSFGGVWVFGVAPVEYLVVPTLAALALGLAAVPLGRRDPRALVVGVAVVCGVGAAAAVLAGPGVRVLFG